MPIVAKPKPALAELAKKRMLFEFVTKHERARFVRALDMMGYLPASSGKDTRSSHPFWQEVRPTNADMLKFVAALRLHAMRCGGETRDMHELTVSD